MTVSSTSSRNVLAGNGSATQFPAGFRVDQPGDLVVIYTDANGNVTTLTTGQYTTDGAFGSAFPNGPTVTYLPTAGPIATGTTLTLERVISSTQPTSLSNQGAMWPQVIEAALDRVVMIVQGFIDGMSRALQIAPNDGSTLNPLPPAATRANGYLGFDGNGQPTVLAAPSGSTPISVAMAAVVNQSTTALARTAMGALGAADSPSITGTFDFTGGRIKAPTRTTGDSGTDAASTAFVQTAASATVRALTSVADANVAPTDATRTIRFTSLTAARSVTLPAASTVTAGTWIDILDASGSASATNSISLVPNGTDTIAGSNTTQVCMNVARGSSRIMSNGSNGWHVEKWDVVYEAFATTDTALNNTSTWISGTGLSLAQGTAGTWEVEAGMVGLDTAGAAGILSRITDGTTVVVAAFSVTEGISNPCTNFLRGRISSPAGNLVLQGKDTTSTSGVLKANATGNTNKDSYIRARRVA